MKASMSTHYLLNVSDLYCILRSYFILKNVAVHAAASVIIKDESWNSVYDRPHDALEDDIDINNWSYLDQTTNDKSTMEFDGQSVDSEKALKSDQVEVHLI